MKHAPRIHGTCAGASGQIASTASGPGAMLPAMHPTGLPDANQMALRLAADLSSARQPLAAALVCAELARGGFTSPELWCALGSSLMASRGVAVREPFEAWAAKVFRRGAPMFAGTVHAEVVEQWLQELPEAAATPPLQDHEATPLIEFLLVHERVLPEAARALEGDARMSMVIVLGDRAEPLYVPLLRDAIEGHLGDGAARSALKRIGPFVTRPDVQASLLTARDEPAREDLGPYLSCVTDRLPASWDAPRSAAGPPYEGVGGVDVELVVAGEQPEACIAALREHLRASDRDARAWVSFAPCLVKRGATRHEATTLRAALEGLGALVKLGFTSGDDLASRAPDAVARRWWKFW